jgi:hypothetical protein
VHSWARMCGVWHAVRQGVGCWGLGSMRRMDAIEVRCRMWEQSNIKRMGKQQGRWVRERGRTPNPITTTNDLAT